MASYSAPQQSSPAYDFYEDWYQDPPPIDSPFQHSRDSSCGSSAPSPITSTFSSHSHNRYPSGSSLATSPDLSVTHAKSALHDLVEDPSEREDSFDLEPEEIVNEPLCICDTSFCEHRTSNLAQSSAYYSAAVPEWLPGDDYFSDSELSGLQSIKRRRSGEGFADSFTARWTRRWPSFTQRIRESKRAPSLSSKSVRSTPSSRPSSLRLPSLRRSTAESRSSRVAQDIRPMPEQLHHVPQSRASSTRSYNSEIVSPLGIDFSRHSDQSVEDPIDREKLSSTPLLPPALSELNGSYFPDELNSPLQSPTVASLSGSPVEGPSILPTPPLSAKPSITSITGSDGIPYQHQHHDTAFLLPTTSSTFSEPDPYANLLGHANFHITPEPYMPSLPTSQTCATLLADWSSARSKYLEQAFQISRLYGPTSSTYALTAQKWDGIEARWRGYYEQAYAEALAAGGEKPVAQSLAPMPRSADVVASAGRLHGGSSTGNGSGSELGATPLLSPTKFPGLRDRDNGDFGEDGDERAAIVGPMVQYSRILPPSSPAGTATSSPRVAGTMMSQQGRARSSIATAVRASISANLSATGAANESEGAGYLVSPSNSTAASSSSSSSTKSFSSSAAAAVAEKSSRRTGAGAGLLRILSDPAQLFGGLRK